MPIRDIPCARHRRCEWCKHFIPLKQMIFHQVVCGCQPAVKN
jgi:hypothetical protein